jgi:hypothetical protein
MGFLSLIYQLFFGGGGGGGNVRYNEKTELGMSLNETETEI